MGGVVGVTHFKSGLPHHLTEVVVLEGCGLAIQETPKVLEAQESFLAESQDEAFHLGVGELPCFSRWGSDAFEDFPIRRVALDSRRNFKPRRL